jgi:eukaryotic-like serine/threonine-protein kinase
MNREAQTCNDVAKSLFLYALEIESKPDREAFLRERCEGDESLRAEVQALLEHHEALDDYLERPAFDSPALGWDAASATAAWQSEHEIGTLIGSYRLLEQIGEGGMGIVYMAEQIEPVRRKVALKLIKPGMDSRQVIARLEVERQALAMMDHPNIARVFDAGTTELGRPYFAMELVRGVPITQFCDEAKLSIRERLDLFVLICHAVQHAHQKGVIHRDIKPTNVLVTLHDGIPVPKVIDFGVAKAVGESLTERTLHTGFMQLIGTPLYMSPEQAELSGLDVDTRSDIYSLGVLLYELLTGSPPLDREDFRSAPLDQVRRMIREQNPPRPSTRLSHSVSPHALAAIASQRRTEPSKLAKFVRGDLDWIVLKAMEKDRTRRYETANGLASDIERHLNDEPVTACSPSPVYRFGKFLRRHRAFVLGALAVALVLVGGIVGTSWGLLRALAEARAKEAALKLSETNLRLAQQAVDEIYAPVAQQLAVAPFMQPYQREVLQKSLRFYERFAERQSIDPSTRFEAARAAVAVANIRHAFGQEEKAERAGRQALAALKTLASERPADSMCLKSLASAHTILGGILDAAGRLHDADSEYQQALELNDRLSTELADDQEYRSASVDLYQNLASHLSKLHRLTEARQMRHEAVRRCEELLAQWPDEPRYKLVLARADSLLGSALFDDCQPVESEKFLRAAVALLEEDRIATNRTNYRFILPSALCVLASALAARHEDAAAETTYRKAIASWESHIEQFPDLVSCRMNLAASHVGLSKLLAENGRLDESAKLKRSAREIYNKLAAEYPDGTIPDSHWFESLTEFGRGLRSVGDMQGAEKALRRALEMAERATLKSPDEVRHRQKLALLHRSLGTVLQLASRAPEAASEFEKALHLFESLATEFPSEPAHRYWVANTRNFLGILLRSQPEHRQKASALHRKAIKECERLVSENSRIKTWHVELARSHYALGIVWRLQDCWTEALDSFQNAIDASGPVMNQAALRGSQYASILNEKAWLLATCLDSNFVDAQGAVESARKAVALDPKGMYWNTLGIAEYRAGNWDESIAAFDRSTKLQNGGDSYDWFFLAMARWRRGERDEARREYDRAVQWMTQHAQNHQDLRRFRAEAAEVLGLSDPKSSSPEEPRRAARE